METMKQKINDTLKNLYDYYSLLEEIKPAKTPLQMWKSIESIFTDNDLLTFLDWVEVTREKEGLVANYKNGNFESRFPLASFGVIVLNLNSKESKSKSYNRALALQNKVRNLKICLTETVSGDPLKFNIKGAREDYEYFKKQENNIAFSDLAMHNYTILKDFIKNE